MLSSSSIPVSPCPNKRKKNTYRLFLARLYLLLFSVLLIRQHLGRSEGQSEPRACSLYGKPKLFRASETRNRYFHVLQGLAPSPIYSSKCFLCHFHATCSRDTTIINSLHCKLITFMVTTIYYRSSKQMRVTERKGSFLQGRILIGGWRCHVEAGLTNHSSRCVCVCV